MQDVRFFLAFHACCVLAFPVEAMGTLRRLSAESQSPNTHTLSAGLHLLAFNKGSEGDRPVRKVTWLKCPVGNTKEWLYTVLG